MHLRLRSLPRAGLVPLAWVSSALVALCACGPIGGVDDSASGGRSSTSSSAAGGPAAVSTPVVLPDLPAFKVVGYLPTWANNSAGLQFSKLNFVNYAFAIEHADGSVSLTQPTKPLVDLVARGHAAGVRVLLSVGGWNDGHDEAFNALAADPTARAAFATAIDGYMDQYQLDGVDIDWEFPEENVAASFLAMIREVSGRLKPKGRLVTIAGAAFRGGAAGVTSDALPYIDLVNIMAYDGDNGSGHSPYAFAQASLQLWLDKGVPASKAILGIPFYSRPSNTAYSALVGQNAQAADLDQLNDQFYNGIPTVRAKTALALSSAGGIMAWDLSEDAAVTPNSPDVSLVSAIYAAGHPTGTAP